MNWLLAIGIFAGAYAMGMIHGRATIRADYPIRDKYRKMPPMRFTVLFALGLAAVGCGGGGSSSVSQPVYRVAYVITETGISGPTSNTIVTAVNSGDELVGSAESDFPSTPSVGFEGNASQSSNLAVPTECAALGVSPTAINSAGEVAGYGFTAINSPRALLWVTPSTVQDIGDLGGGQATALGISSLGQVVGYSLDSNGKNRPFSWLSGSGMINLSSSFAVGMAASATNSGGSIAAFWQPGPGDGEVYIPGIGVKTIPDFGGGSSSPFALSDSNVAVGASSNAKGTNHGFTWTLASGLAAINEPAGTAESQVRAINASGTIGGEYQPSAGQSRAFVQTATGSFMDLNNVTSGIPSGVTLTMVNAIANDGTLICEGSDHIPIVLTPVATPALTRKATPPA